MNRTAEEVALAVDGSLHGDAQRRLRGIRPLDQAGPQDLSFLGNPRYGAQARASNSSRGVGPIGDEGRVTCWGSRFLRPVRLKYALSSARSRIAPRTNCRRFAGAKPTRSRSGVPRGETRSVALPRSR